MKINIICPECRRKLLGKAEDNTSCTLYLWCKNCKKEIKVILKSRSL